MPITILIADDHAMVRDGLKMILENADGMRVVAMAADGREAVVLAEEHRPDVILMDISMPGLNGIEAARLIHERLPATRVLILSMHHSAEHIFRALRAGASGYLLKESAGSEVVTAVRTVLKGNRFFGKGVKQPLERRHGKDRSLQKSPLDSLSRRELEVLQLVVEGKTSVEIGEVLSLSPKSIETYRSRLMLKLVVTNIPALVRFAMQHGIIPAD
ncbi:MAG: response regulator transcription factor [Steroidobacteraceae bacterium]|nr:response regulator transcription factor [Deltaproteobacteria bacterium]